MLKTSVVGVVRHVLHSFHYDIVRKAPPTSGPAFLSSLGSQLKFLLDALKIDCVLDVGAHVGEFGRYLREIGYAGYIVSLEPVGASFEELHQHTRGDAKWLAYKLAAGSATGSASINLMGDSELNSFRHFTPLGARLLNDQFVSTEVVDVVRVDRFVDEHQADFPATHIFLKLDTQGWDIEAARGAIDILHRVQLVQTEVAVQSLYDGVPSLEASLDFFKKAGYAISGFFPVAFDFAALTAVEVDMLFVRAT